MSDESQNNHRKFNTEEAADFLKNNEGVPFTKGTLEVWRCLGRGPRFIRIGRRCFYEKSALEEFARGQVVETIDSIRVGAGM